MPIVLETCPAPNCNLTPRDVESLLDHLAVYHAHFAPAFARAKHAYWAAQYLRGLLSTCERNSIEPMALHLDLPIRPLQHFIGQSTWATAPLIAQYQALVGTTLGEPDGAFLVDECGVVKQGHDSLGVARSTVGRSARSPTARWVSLRAMLVARAIPCSTASSVCQTPGLPTIMRTSVPRPACRQP